MPTNPAIPCNAVENITMFAHPIHPCKDEIESQFVRYLTVCALEKRGPHSLGGMDETAKRPATPEDITFLQTYVKNAIRQRNQDPIRTGPFLKSILHNATVRNVTVHLARDYQVIETGGHYVTMTFCMRTDENRMYRIKFTAKFDVGDDFAEHVLCYLRVHYFDDCHYVHAFTVNPYSTLIRGMSTKHLIDVDYVPNIDNSIEA